MKILRGFIAPALLVLGALGLAQVAHARSDVYWSVGIGAPGVAIGVGNAVPPILVHQAPVYVAPPVYYAPPPVRYRPARRYNTPARHYVPKPHYRKPQLHQRPSRRHRR